MGKRGQKTWRTSAADSLAEKRGIGRGGKKGVKGRKGVDVDFQSKRKGGGTGRSGQGSTGKKKQKDLRPRTWGAKVERRTRSGVYRPGRGIVASPK